MTTTRVTAYSQRDPRWSRQKLASGKWTIGQVGCLLSCLASCLTDATGKRITPPELDAWLLAHDGYDLSNSNLLFSAIGPLGLQRQHVLSFTAADEASLRQLQAELRPGRYVVIFVDTPPGGPIVSHWVRLVNDQTWRIMDPAQMPDHEMTNLTEYALPTWPLERAVRGYVVYQRESKL